MWDQQDNSIKELLYEHNTVNINLMWNLVIFIAWHFVEMSTKTRRTAPHQNKPIWKTADDTSWQA